jgi:hypothetical protein
MLRHSLYKKFGKKYMQSAGVNTNNLQGAGLEPVDFQKQFEEELAQQQAYFQNNPLTLPKKYTEKEIKKMKKSFPLTGEDFFTPNQVPTDSQPLPKLEGLPQDDVLSITEYETSTPASVKQAQGISIAAENALAPEDDTEDTEDTEDTKEKNPIDWSSWATLGLAGVSSALNFKDDLRREDELNRSIQQRQSKPVYDYNYMYGRTTSGGTEYQPIIMAKQGAQISTRPNTPQYGVNNVEIENNEYLILPDGTTEIASGPSHSDKYQVNGVSMGGTNTNLPEGTRVFSDHLTPGDLQKLTPEEKMMKLGAFMQSGGELANLDFNTFMAGGTKGKDSNKTFAQIAKKYDSTKYKEILDNPFSKQVDKNTAAIMMAKNEAVLDKLFQEQQLLNGNSTGEPMPQMKEGGINNPGFKALPAEVQQKILSNMQGGGTSGSTSSYKVLGTEVDSEGNTYQILDLGNNKRRKQLVVPQSKIKTKGEAKVGDYYRNEQGNLVRVTNQRSALPQYKGEDFNRAFAGNPEVAGEYAYLEQQLADPEVRAALVEKSRAAAKNQAYYTGKKGKTSKAYGQLSDIDNISVDEIIKNFLELNKRNLALKARGVDLTKVGDPNDPNSVTNKRLAAEFEAAGIPLVEDPKVAALQQATYLGYRDLIDARTKNELSPELAQKIQYFDIGQRGVTDEPGTIAGNRKISPIDAAYTNTTAGQYARSILPSVYDEQEIIPEEFTQPVPGEPPAMVKPKFGTYEREPYDVMQAVPGMYALAQSQEIFPYAIPEINAPYIKPQTLNIQSQLQDVDNMQTAALRAGADPNMAYAMALDAKNKAYQTKQNYDAEGRWKADVTNFEADLKTQMANAELFDRTYNQLYGTAKAKQSEAKQAALTNLIESRAQYEKDESLKELYSKNFMPSYSYDANTRTWIPVANPIYNQKTPLYNTTINPGDLTSTAPVTETTTTKTKKTARLGAYVKMGGQLYKKVKKNN